jgi:hypothetical protein
MRFGDSLTLAKWPVTTKGADKTIRWFHHPIDPVHYSHDYLTFIGAKIARIPRHFG